MHDRVGRLCAQVDELAEIVEMIGKSAKANYPYDKLSNLRGQLMQIKNARDSEDHF